MCVGGGGVREAYAVKLFVCFPKILGTNWKVYNLQGGNFKQNPPNPGPTRTLSFKFRFFFSFSILSCLFHDLLSLSFTFFHFFLPFFLIFHPGKSNELFPSRCFIEELLGLNHLHAGGMSRMSIAIQAPWRQTVLPSSAHIWVNFHLFLEKAASAAWQNGARLQSSAETAEGCKLDEGQAVVPATYNLAGWFF